APRTRGSFTPECKSTTPALLSNSEPEEPFPLFASTARKNTAGMALSPADVYLLEKEARAREDEDKRKHSRPNVSEETAGSLVTRLFGKEVSSVTRLDSYDDANFKIVEEGSGETFTLKIHNGWDSRDEALIVALNHVVLYVSDRGFVVPAPVRA
ncbi:unnamed protein product, partial [Ectocarpus sp. 4 AP-2014]